MSIFRVSFLQLQLTSAFRQWDLRCSAISRSLFHSLLLTFRDNLPVPCSTIKGPSFLFYLSLSYMIFSFLLFFPLHLPFLRLTVPSCYRAVLPQTTPRKHTFFLPSTSFKPATLLASITLFHNQSPTTPMIAYLSVTSTLDNVSKINAIVFIRVGRRFLELWQVQQFLEPIH